MTRGLGWFVVTCALVAVLIPYPGLLPVSLIGLAIVWFATPTSRSRPKTRRVSRSESRSSVSP